MSKYISKKTRLAVYEKYEGKCAYCGKDLLGIKNMQVDHIWPVRRYERFKDVHAFENLNPSCRRCNHYKSVLNLEEFRGILMTLHERASNYSMNKVAADYGIVSIKAWDGVFHFEQQ